MTDQEFEERFNSLVARKQGFDKKAILTAVDHINRLTGFLMDNAANLSMVAENLRDLIGTKD